MLVVIFLVALGIAVGMYDDDLPFFGSSTECSNDCSQLYRNISATNGRVSCESEILTLHCDMNYTPVTQEKVPCKDLYATSSFLQCKQQVCPAPPQPLHGQVRCNNTHKAGTSCRVKCTHKDTRDQEATIMCQEDLTWSSLSSCPPPPPPPCYGQGPCKESVAILAGGEKEGILVADVRPYPTSYSGYTACIPPLPEAMKWASMGYVGGTLLVCGGETCDACQIKSCWFLDKRTPVWRKHSMLTNLRSQSATAVSTDGMFLSIISGYADWTKDNGLDTWQKVGDIGPEEEKELRVATKSYSTRLAYAVTLSNNEILVTGGRTRERQVVLITSNIQGEAGMKECSSMWEGRVGHTGAKVEVGGEEQVLVAGGFNVYGKALDSVELYNPKQDFWTQLPNMPQPRAEFMLQVGNKEIAAIGGWRLEEGRRMFPGLARVAWSEDAVWGKWLEEVREDQQKINSFMFAWVPIAWIESVCSMQAPDLNHPLPATSPTTTPTMLIPTFEATQSSSEVKMIIGVCIAIVAVAVTVSLLCALQWYLHSKRGSSLTVEEANLTRRLFHESPLTEILIKEIPRPHRPDFGINLAYVLGLGEEYEIWANNETNHRKGATAKARHLVMIWQSHRADNATPAAMIEALKRMRLTDDIIMQIEENCEVSLTPSPTEA